MDNLLQAITLYNKLRAVARTGNDATDYRLGKLTAKAWHRVCRRKLSIN